MLTGKISNTNHPNARSHQSKSGHISLNQKVAMGRVDKHDSHIGVIILDICHLGATLEGVRLEMKHLFNDSTSKTGQISSTMTKQ